MAKRHFRTLAPWLLAGVAGAFALAWVFPRIFPLFPDDWQVSAGEAEAIALERLRDLGELPDDPYVVSRLRTADSIAQRLTPLLDRHSAHELRQSALGKRLFYWTVTVHAPGAATSDWSYVVDVLADGEVAELRTRVPSDERLPTLAPDEARERADAFLAAQGFDLSRYDAPEPLSVQLQTRTDLTLHYRDREAVLGPDEPYGVEVSFAGDRLVGFAPYFDNAREAESRQLAQPVALMSQLWIFIALPILPLVGFFFLRRYHHGEIGPRRGLQILTIVLSASLLMLLLVSRAASAGWNMGVLTRQQTTWVVGIQLMMLFFFPIALMAFLSWSVGESLARERWGAKLAAFDALFKGDRSNATFARAALRGVVGGVLLVLALWSSAALLDKVPGVYLSIDTLFGPWWESSEWFAVPLLLWAVAYSLYSELFGRLLLVSAFVQRLGTWVGGALAVLVAAAIFWPPMFVLPLVWSLPLWLLSAAVLVVLFLRYGLFTALLASVTAKVVDGAVPFLLSEDPGMQLQASLALLAVALPMLLSLRHLLGERDFAYRWEDVPPHVRRIADRERQRVELETARNIQSSILPELPPRLAGVDIAHAYLPATEVGGDFYDVLALEDGRLALAVGDVAGHGVSSGLVMSMARSALAVQVTFDPEVASVFRTMNRMVYQTARKRLLTTLCYAVLDPVRLELVFGSAGHLYPYRIANDGKVEALESIAYPLGVRNPLPVSVRSARLAAGDTLFLFSDGVVEARREGSDDVFGFDRLEDSLRHHFAGGVAALRDGILADLERFTAGGPREDDQTLLALRLP